MIFYGRRLLYTMSINKYYNNPISIFKFIFYSAIIYSKHPLLVPSIIPRVE